VKTISFRIVRRDKVATCEDCKATFTPTGDGAFEVTPHLRSVHGFTDAEISFEKTAEVICPPMIVMEARQ
jgi:hypothetical protein